MYTNNSAYLFDEAQTIFHRLDDGVGNILFIETVIPLYLTANMTSTNITGHVVPETGAGANINVDVSTILTANYYNTANSIKGVARPNATITVTVED